MIWDKKVLCASLVGMLILSGIVIPSIGSGYLGEITIYPETIEIITNNLTGSQLVSFWSNQSLDSVNITILNSNETSYMNEEIYQDTLNIGNTTESWLRQMANSTYTHNLTVNETNILDIHIIGQSDAPDLDLAVFLDGLNGQPLDGIAQWEEIIDSGNISFDCYGDAYGSGKYAQSADYDADEAIRFFNPPNGTYIIKVLGYDVRASPGHMDMIINQLSNDAGIFNVTDVNPAALPAHNLGYFNLTWDIPGGSSDGEFKGGYYIGTDSEFNISLVPITLTLDTLAPDIVPSYPVINQEIDDSTPTIQVDFGDSDFGQLDSETARLWVDGIEVTKQSTRSFPLYDDYNNPPGGYMYGTITYEQKTLLSNGAHSIKAEVCDFAGNLVSESWIFMVDNPYQLYLQHTPEIMTSINHITPIEAIVESNYDVSSMKLFWILEGDASFTEETMAQVGSNQYYSEIPVQTSEGVLHYYLRAEDTEGNIITSPGSNPVTQPHMLSVNIEDSPIISHLAPTLYGDSALGIDAAISDNTGIDSATLYYRSQGDMDYTSVNMAGGTGHIYSAAIDTALFTPDPIEYYILASDGTNNVTHPLNISEPHVIQYSSTFVAGGDLRVAILSDTDSFNPISDTDEWSKMILERIYDKPITKNPDTNQQMPYIAVGTASTSTSLDYTLGQLDWSDCDVGVFDFTPGSTWGMEYPASSIGEAIVYYDFEDVTWHDGVQMDVRDIMFSFHAAAQVPGWSSDMNCLKDNAGGASSNYSSTSWLHIYKVWESADQKQAALKFVMMEPFADFFTNTLSPVLLPEHLWAYTVSGQNVDGAKIWCDPGYNSASADSWQSGLAKAWDNLNPVGSDWFKFIQFNPGDSIELETWQDHFFKEGYKYNDYVLDFSGGSHARLPNIDNLTFKEYNTAESAVLALRNNEVDIIGTSLPPTFVQELLNEPDIGIQQTPEQSFTYMGYNVRRESFGYDETKSYPYAITDDLGKPLRKAIAHCIDKNRVVDRLLLNYGIQGEGPISSISSWFNQTIPRYSFDPQEAGYILENAGYVLEDPGQPASPTNYWNNPGGSEIGSGAGGVIEILTPEANYDPIAAQTGLMIAMQLQEVGINAELIQTEHNTLVNRIETRDFDMYIDRYAVDSEPPEFLYDFFHTDNAATGQNYIGYQNVSYDQIMDLARATGDLSTREQAINDAQGALGYDLPLDVLYFRTRIEAYRSDQFTGWTVGSSGSMFNDISLKNIQHPLLQQSSLLVDETEFGGSLRVALQSEPDTINPLDNPTEESASKIIDLLYDPLARVDPNTLELIPWMAEGWTVSADNLTVTVSLRSNITWHDDSNLTANDVKHSFDTYALPYITSTTVIDPLTLEFNLASPDARFFDQALKQPLFPMGFDAASQENGCGPFKLMEMVAGDHITLEANENYFNGRANVDRIIFTYYPYEIADFSVEYPYSSNFAGEDPRWAGAYRAGYDLITGGLDFIGWGLASNETTRIIEVGWNMTTLMLNSGVTVKRNLGTDLQQIIINTQQSPLNDTDLRQAIAQAMDRSSLSQYDISGGVQKSNTIISKGDFPCWNDTISDGGDIEYANHLMDEAGYFDRNGDGWRQLPYAPYDEFNITMLGPPQQDVTPYTMATNIVTWIKQIGINATLDYNTTAVNWPKVENDNFDMYFGYFDVGDTGQVLKNLAESGSSSNYANYADATFDNMIDTMNSEMNESKRSQYAKDCEGYLSQTVPYVPLFHHKIDNAYDKARYDGWVSTLGGIANFWSYLNLYPLFDPSPVDAPNALYAYDPEIGGAINLTWAHNHEVGLTGYNVYRSNVTGGPYEFVKTTGLVTSYQDTEIENEIDYYYVITALGSESDFSSEVHCRASDIIPPTVLWTSPADGEVDVNVSTVISVLFSEKMNQTSVESSFSYTDGTNTWDSSDGISAWASGDNFTFTPGTNLSFNTTFNVSIDRTIAKDLVGNALDGADGYSWAFTTESEMLDTIAPAAPINLDIDNPETGDSLNLSWDANSESDLAGYRVYRSETSGSGYSMVVDIGLNTSYQDTGLTENITYYYVVTAYDNAEIPNESNYSNQASGTPSTPPVEEEPTGTISGTVRDEDGNPIANATVTVEGTNLTVVTDENGEYTITGVPVGNQTLVITGDGFEEQRIDIEIVEGETTEVPEITLPPDEEEKDNNMLWVAIIIIVICATIGALYFISKRPAIKPEAGEPQIDETGQSDSEQETEINSNEDENTESPQP